MQLPSSPRSSAEIVRGPRSINKSHCALPPGLPRKSSVDHFLSKNQISCGAQKAPKAPRRPSPAPGPVGPGTPRGPQPGPSRGIPGQAPGRANHPRRLFNPVALPRRSATAPEQLGCQVNWWMCGLSGGPFPAQNDPQTHPKLAISGRQN